MATRQALQAIYSANANLTTPLPIDDTVPTATEGVEVLSQSITLASSANKVLVELALWGRTFEVNWGAALFRGSTCLHAQAHIIESFDLCNTIGFDILDAPGSVGPHVYSVRAGSESGAVLRLNGVENARRFGGASKCTLILREIG